jgi:chromosome segregation ATPase
LALFGDHRRLEAAMTRPRHLSRLCLAAAALGALSLGGCKTTSLDDATFFAFAGEVPGSRTPYVDYETATRLAKGPPHLRLVSFRPAVTPAGAATGETARLRTDFANIRQQLSDRDDELRLRRRSLILYAAQYAKAKATLQFIPGDPLPAYDARFRGRIRAAQTALTNLEGDLTKMSGTLSALDGELRTAGAVAARARALSAQPPEAGTDLKLRAALATAADTTLKAGRQLAAETRRDLGMFVVYISEQREALNRLEAHVRAAKGPTQLEKFRATETVTDWLPKSWQPAGYGDKKKKGKTQ